MVLFLVVLFLLIAIYIRYQFHIHYYSYNIQGFSSSFLWHYLVQKKNVKVIFQELFEKYDDICKCWIGPVLFIILSKPEYIEKTSHEFMVKLNNLMKIASGKGVASMDAVQDWKRQRKLLNPSFKLTNLNQHYDVINFWSHKLVSRLQENKEPLYRLVAKNQFCLVSECFFSKKLVSDERADENVTISLRLTKLWLFGLYSFKPIWLLTKQGQKFIETSKKIRDSAVEIVADVEKDKKKHLPITNFMSCLLENDKFSYEEIVGNVQTVTNASTTSTASAEVFAFILLAMHEDIQNNLFEEIESLWDKKTDSLPLESIKLASLLDRVIKETLRLFPPVPSLIRRADKTIILSNNHTIPKRANIVIDFFNIHRDRRIWKDSLKFDPDRFLPQRSQEIKRGSFVPFWLFSRNCIGQYFSMLSLKIAIARVVKSFKITGCQYKNVSEIEIRSSALIEPKDLHLDFILREK